MKLKIQIEKSQTLEKGKSFVFAPGEILIGRKEQGNHIVIAENAISRTHLKITLANDGSIKAQDMGSGNGSFLNGKKITAETSVKTGDKLQIGSTTISVNLDQPKVQSSAAVKPKVKKAAQAGPKTPKGSSAPKNKKNILLVSIFSILIAVLLIFLFKSLKSTPKSDPNMLSNTYLMSETGIKFNHPDNWKRIDKSKVKSFGVTFFPKHELLFGKTSGAHDIILAVDVLESFPSIFSIDEIVASSGNKFPRLIPHDGEYISKEKIDISGIPALLCETDSFKFLGKKLKAFEIFFIHKNRRFLIITFTPSVNFPACRTLFQNIIKSITIEEYANKVKKPENPRAEARRIIKSAEDLVQRKGIKPENLYLANNKYAEAAVIINLFDYRENDPLLKKLLIDFKAARKELDNSIKDYRFTIKKGLKIKEFKDVFTAAKKIMAIIPDPLDKNYQFAEKHYNKLKSKFRLH